MATGTLFVGCDTVVVLNQLTDDGGSVVANATVSGKLFVGQTPVTNGLFTFTPVGGTPGDYQCIVPASLNLVEKTKYSLIITVTFPGSGKVAEFRILRTAAVIDI